MSDFIELTTVDDLEDGTMKSHEIENHDFLIARVGQEYFISDARCPHLHGHLVRGKLDKTILTCPVHHSQFDLSDGHVVRWTDWTGAVLSVTELVRHPRPLRVYECKVEDGKIWVGAEKPPVIVGEETAG
jgi:3-phenylpropionate/trans-cinnamate dioxygenase ferredoxin subunit